MSNFLWNDKEDWSFESIEKVYHVVHELGTKEFGLNIYNNSFEIVSSEQMLDAYSSIGLPLMYKHWSFGKHLIIESENYKVGNSGLAYELVINTDPCINYLMEDNTMTTQALVIAHAALGHNHFFKNNYMFKEYTDASGIIDYLKFAKEYIEKQEIKHGKKVVEEWLDSCHTLRDYGIDKYKRPQKLNLEKERTRQKEREEYIQSQVSDLYPTLNKKEKPNQPKFPAQPQENLLYFFEKYSPDLQDWQREILRIVRKIATYLHPQTMLQNSNEGFACFVHYESMRILHERNMISDGSYLEFLNMHTNVLTQLPYNHKHYSGFNPYALGFAIMKDIKRIHTNPTQEDLNWFTNLQTKPYWEAIKEVVENYNDESMIRQWLSPKVIRDFRLFSVFDDKKDKEKMIISSIHNENGYQDIREKLADQYLRSSRVPDIEVVQVDRKTRTLYLQYSSYRGRKLSNYEKMIYHIEKLWGGYPVVLHDEKGNILAQLPISKPDPEPTPAVDQSYDFGAYCFL